VTNLEGRIIRLELLLQSAQDALRKLDGRAGSLEQQARQPLAQMWQGGGSGGDPIPLWAITPGAVAAATGTWPTLTPSTFTSDVKKDVAGVLTAVATGATIRWFYKDGATIGKLVPVMDNGDGTYDARADSCTRVDV
jgi:hypothetical protein